MNPDSLEWHTARKAGIGGSDIAAILGLSKWRTPRDVWKDKTGRGQDRSSDAMEWGKRLEAAVLEKFADNHGTVERFPLLPAMHRHKGVPIAFASLDGMLRLPDGTGQPVDAKTTRVEWDSVPGDYWMQVQWQMGVSGTSDGWLAVLRSGRDYSEIPIAYDQRVFEDALEYAQMWWRDYVLTDTPPPVTVNDDLQSAFQPDPALAVDLPADVWEPYLAARRDYLAAKEWLDAVENDVKLLVGDATKVRVDGQRVATWNPVKGGVRVDSKKLMSEYPDVYAAVVKEGKESRSWRVK